MQTEKMQLRRNKTIISENVSTEKNDNFFHLFLNKQQNLKKTLFEQKKITQKNQRRKKNAITTFKKYQAK